jgi:Glutamine amidotransferase class-I
MTTSGCAAAVPPHCAGAVAPALQLLYLPHVRATPLLCAVVPPPSLQVTLVPHDHDLVSALPSFDGLFLSNGPGDPTMAGATIEALRRVLGDVEAGVAPVKPIFGICLGNQLLSLAAGAKAVSDKCSTLVLFNSMTWSLAAVVIVVLEEGCSRQARRLMLL